jgi:hypothetical protein
VIVLDLAFEPSRSIITEVKALFAARCVAQLGKDVIMTSGPLRASAIALGAAAFALFSPLAPAHAATVTHNYGHAARYAHAAPSRVAHGVHGRGVHGYVAQRRVGHRHYVWRNGHRYGYGYGYNPGAAVAAGVVAGAAAGYPYCGDYSYGPYSCDDYSYGYPYPNYDYGFDFGGPVFFGRNHFHHGVGNGFAFHGGGPHFAGGNFGHMGGFGGGGFGGGHMGGFGGGHMGGFGGGHMGGGGHFR